MKKIFIPVAANVDVLPVLKKAEKTLAKYRSIGVVTTVQHLHKMEEVSNVLGRGGKKVVVGGQILGCNQKNAMAIADRIDAFLYIGSGKFHPLGIAFKTEKPVFIANPYSCTVEKIENEEIAIYKKKRFAAIKRAAASKTFGIVISTRGGQMHLDAARDIKRKIEEVEGREAFLFAGENITNADLSGFDVDCWINTACDRLIDDHFDKPFLSLEEAKYLLNLIR